MIKCANYTQFNPKINFLCIAYIKKFHSNEDLANFLIKLMSLNSLHSCNDLNLHFLFNS